MSTRRRVPLLLLLLVAGAAIALWWSGAWEVRTSSIPERAPSPSRPTEEQAPPRLLGSGVPAFPQRTAPPRAADEAERDPTIVGRCVDVRGRPVRDARVRVIRVERSPEEAARSGESGGLEIRLQSAASARAYLEATHPSFAPAILATTLPVRGVRVDVGDVVLAPGTRLTGRVIDDHRVPVPGAIVHWSHAFSATWPNPLLGDAPPLRGDVRADEEGLFALDALPPGVLYLRASQGASSTWIASPSVRLDPDLGTQAVEIVLVPSTPQVLHLASEAGEAVGAATFTEELPVHGVSVPLDAEPTGEPGAWRLRFGASHMSRIGVRAPGFAPTFVTFLPGAEAEVRITLRRGTDGVRIVLPGAVAGARIRVGLVNGAKTPLTVPRMSPDVVGEQALLWRAPPYGIDPRRRVLVLAEGSDTAWPTRDLDAADAAEDAPPVVAERVPVSPCRVACVALESGSPVAGAVVRTTRDPSSPGATLSSPWGATCLTPSGAVTLDDPLDDRSRGRTERW